MSTSAPLTVVPPLAAEALGNSVIYEEYKGDFAQARALAEDHLLQVRRNGDSAVLADALLARGIIHVLQGEPSAALACFQEIDKLVPTDFDRRLRAISYTRLAKLWQYNLFPDGGGAGGTEIRARWDGVAYTEAETPRKQAVFLQSSNTLARFESVLIYSFLCDLQPERSFVQSGWTNTQAQMGQQLLDAAVQAVIDFRRTAELYNVAPAIRAFANLAAADLCVRAHDLSQARNFLTQAIEIYQQNGDSIGQGACLLALGDWWSAPFTTPKVWNLTLQEGSSAGNDLAWATEAQEFSQEGSDLGQADTAYTEAAKLFASAEASRGLAQVLLRRCYLAMLADDHAAATAFAFHAQMICDQCGDRLSYWLSQTQRILCRIGAGEYPEESATAEKIGVWGATEGSFSYTLGLGLLCCRVARHWLIRKGDYERSLACSRLAAIIFQALGATVNFIQCLVDQGAVYLALGESKAAIALFERAIDYYLTESTGRSEYSVAFVMLAVNLFNLFQDNMDANGMERTANRLQTITAQAAQTGGIAAGAVQMLAGTIIEQSQFLVPLYRAVAARDAGDLTQAQEFFSTAMYAAEMADPTQRDFQKSVILGHQRVYEEAKQAFKRYLTQGGASAGFVGQLTNILQHVGGAQGQREAMCQLARTHEQALTMFVRLKAFNEAKVHLDALSQLVGTEWWALSEKPWQELGDCAELYEGLNDLDQALVFYDRAINTLEARRSRLSREELKTSLAAGSSVQYLYFHAARTTLKYAERTPESMIAEAWASRALAYVERGKARSLLDLMASSVMVAGSPRTENAAMRAWRSTSAQLALWRGLMAKERSRTDANAQRVAQLNQEIERLGAQLYTTEDALSKADPTFYQHLNVQAEVMTLDEIRTALPAQTALLEYAFLGDDLLIWAVTDQGVAVQRRCAADAKALGREISAYHRICMDPGSDAKAMGELGATLANQLLMPMADALQACPNLIVVPYGAAHTLPFHALPWAGEPLIASHALSYLPSASMLQFVRPGVWPKLPEQMLAVGNPQAMAYRLPLSSVSVSLPALRGAEDEATHVANLFAVGHALTGDEATEAKVIQLLGHYPLLHFATHGLLVEDAPLLSAILLAGGEALSVYELMGLHLDADLVVLSACRTALGELTRGDEVIGLTRGLLGAGARAAVVSLWPVNDVSTSLLMGEFYRQLRISRSPTIALQAAQNYLRQLSASQIKAEVDGLKDAGFARDATRTGVTKPASDYHHPHFWAPFVLIG